MIKISEKKIIEAAEKGMDEFLSVFTDAYLEAIGGKVTAENMDKLSWEQHTLLALHFFTTEMNEGGFVQLIQNGYGGYIFDNPLAKSLKQFGAESFPKIIYKAKEIYDANKEELERETTDEEFNAMYVDFEQFDDLEEQFFYCEEKEIALIASFVDDNIERFAEVVKE
jgi:hypothetical protein